MSGPHPLPELACRKCGRPNPWVYFAPVVVEGTGTCICMDCAAARGWLDRSGNLKPGVTLALLQTPPVRNRRIMDTRRRDVRKIA